MSKTLCINNGYRSEKYPNNYGYIQTIVNCLEKAGFDVDLFVIRFNRKITPFYKLIKYLQFWFNAIFIDLKGYDIIYINHLPFVWPILFNRTIKTKRVYVHWHGNDLVSESYFAKWSLNLIKKKAIGFKHITPSQYFKGKLMEIMEYTTDDIYVSPSGGVNTTLFTPKLRSMSENVIIGYSASLIKSKGADLFLEIIKKKKKIEAICNKRITFKAINYGAEAECYVKLYKMETQDIEIINKLPKSKMPSFYQSIDVFVMPSLGESLGLVVLEAMSCGVPVITHNLCAFPEFVISGTSGELVDYCDNINERADRYIKALIKVINNYQIYSPIEIIQSRYNVNAVVELYKTFL